MLNKVVPIALLLLASSQAFGEAKCGPWSDEAGRWELERSDSNYSTCTDQANCKTKGKTQATTDGNTKTSGYAYYTYQSAMRCDFVAPSVQCTAPKPADQTQTATCPAPLVGTYGQVKTAVAVPYPTCWTFPSAWTNVQDPSVVCAQPPTEIYTRCAGEGAQCAFSGFKRVCYAAEAAHCTDMVASNEIRLDRSGPISCTNSTFMSDPAPFVVKSCFLSNAVLTQPEPDPGEGLSLTWIRPLKNTDGSDVTNLAGYRIYYGNAIEVLNNTIAVPQAGATGYIIEGLAANTYYFAVRAYNSSGIESANSNIVRVVID